MSERVDKAVQNYRNHYNCAQAVFCAYCDLVGLDETTAFRLSEGFGAGMGIKATCGAVCGAMMILSYLKSDGLLNGGKTKGATYQEMNKIAEEFSKVYGSVMCRDIPKDPTIRCEDKVRVAAEILEKLIAK